MTYARDERAALCSLLDDLGPAAPTLCEGWSTRDLAAHLVIREHRPDAGGGLAGRGPLAGYTRRVQGKRARTPFPQLVQMLRQGPPRLSFFGLPGADSLANTVEFFVHHEDVRRAQPGWQPRTLEPGLADELWRRLKSARFFLRKAPVGLEFARETGPANGRPGPPGPGHVRITAKARTPVVTVIGAPAELTMWAAGRTSAALVRLEGSPSAVQAVLSPAWRGHG